MDTGWHVTTRTWSYHAGTRPFRIDIYDASRSTATEAPPPASWDNKHSPVVGKLCVARCPLIATGEQRGHLGGRRPCLPAAHAGPAPARLQHGADQGAIRKLHGQGSAASGEVDAHVRGDGERVIAFRNRRTPNDTQPFLRRAISWAGCLAVPTGLSQRRRHAEKEQADRVMFHCEMV